MNKDKCKEIVLNHKTKITIFSSDRTKYMFLCFEEKLHEDWIKKKKTKKYYTYFALVIHDER